MNVLFLPCFVSVFSFVQLLRIFVVYYFFFEVVTILLLKSSQDVMIDSCVSMSILWVTSESNGNSVRQLFFSIISTIPAHVGLACRLILRQHWNSEKTLPVDLRLLNWHALPTSVVAFVTGHAPTLLARWYPKAVCTYTLSAWAVSDQNWISYSN